VFVSYYFHVRMKSSQSSSSGSGIAIDFQPHPHTLTESGKSHFSSELFFAFRDFCFSAYSIIIGPVDALAEFVDNSIQACRDVRSEKRISVTFFEEPSTKTSSSFLMVCDNGQGLNPSEIQQFATFSLDQETRGVAPSETDLQRDTSYISKFGVGSKQAGFYLGDRITLLTKKANKPEIHKFSLDRSKLNSRYMKDNVYSDTIHPFPSFSPDILENDEKQSKNMMNAILEHITKYSKQYAIFIIKLKDEIKEKILNKADIIVRDLAEIYYFQLNNTEDLQQMAGDLDLAVRFTHLASPINLTYGVRHYFTGEKFLEIVNNDKRNYIKKCINSSNSIFPFTLSIPNIYKKKVIDGMVRLYLLHIFPLLLVLSVLSWLFLFFLVCFCFLRM
jgi:hypothetical protein